MDAITPVRLEAGSLPPDWQPLPEIPASRYTSAGFAQAERDRLWNRSWLCAARESELPDVGSYKMFEKTGQPILLIRGKDRVVRAFYNICRHRGARVAQGETGCTKLLRCMFHSWSYNLEGQLIGVPSEEGFASLDRSGRNLIPVRCESWNGWLFVNPAADAPPLADFLGTLDGQLRSTTMGALRLVAKRNYVVSSNWKTTMDAFLEAYHLDTIHPKTAAAVNDSRYSRIALLEGGHSWQALRRRRLLGDEVSGASQPDITAMDPHFREFVITYNIFPNLVAPIDPVGFPVLLMWPIDVERSEIEVYFLGPEWESERRADFYDNYFRFFDQLVAEDMDNLANIQVSLATGVMSGPLLGFQEQRIYWLHQAIDTLIGADHLPRGQQVADILTATEPEQDSAPELQ